MKRVNSITNNARFKSGKSNTRLLHSKTRMAASSHCRHPFFAATPSVLRLLFPAKLPFFSSPAAHSAAGHRLSSPPARTLAAAAGVAPPGGEVKGSSPDTFLAQDGVSWKSLGVSEQLSLALSSAGLDRPSLVQVELLSSTYAWMVTQHEKNY